MEINYKRTFILRIFILEYDELLIMSKTINKCNKVKVSGPKKYTGQDELYIQYNNLPYMYTFHVAVGNNDKKANQFCIFYTFSI